MFTVRCTQKLLRRLPESVDPSPQDPPTILGDWYANLVMIGRRPLVLAVSENTYLPAVVPLKEARTLRARLRDQIGEVLVRLRVSEGAFEREMAAMETSVLAKTPVALSITLAGLASLPCSGPEQAAKLVEV